MVSTSRSRDIKKLNLMKDGNRWPAPTNCLQVQASEATTLQSANFKGYGLIKGLINEVINE